MLAQKSISLVMVSSILVLSSGIAYGNEIEVNTGNMQVSVNGKTVNIESVPTRRPPSLLERLRIWRSRRSPIPTTSTRTISGGKCQTSSSNYQSTRSSSSGSGIVSSSSSSSTTVCN